MTVKEIEDMIRLFQIPPKKLSMEIDEKSFLCLRIDLSLCTNKDFSGKEELNFNLGETKISVKKV